MCVNSKNITFSSCFQLIIFHHTLAYLLAIRNKLIPCSVTLKNVQSQLSLEIVLVPDGNVSDLEEDESEDETSTAQQVTIDSDKEVLLPGNVGPLQIERNEEIEKAFTFDLNIS